MQKGLRHRHSIHKDVSSELLEACLISKV